MLAGMFCGSFLSCLWWPAKLQQPSRKKKKKIRLTDVLVVEMLI
jgi:hypothetical protein